ncbi:MAG: hypothetical protein MSG64_06475 [Pyrinomonadaceae bacterium MAG19_C2-C3]|nr:hypothetical protein [Pyrinomonadaceae bacterium MAG19_C2-C3]
MRPVSPVIPGLELSEINVGENQDVHGVLPAIRVDDQAFLSRWELTDDEIENITRTRSIYLCQLNYYAPVQPVMLAVEAPVVDLQEIYKDAPADINHVIATVERIHNGGK